MPASTVSRPAAAPAATRPERRGRTTIAYDVLVTIAHLAALGVPGVAGLRAPAAGSQRWLRRASVEGVRLEVHDYAVTVDLYLVIEHDHQVRAVSRAVQAAVARAIHEMVGMEVLAVHIHVEDVAFPEQEAQ